MYTHEFRKGLEKKLYKIAKKSPDIVRAIGKKINEVITCDDISHYKNLRKPLQQFKRVHIGKSFVLVFSVEENHIIFEDFDHHDNIYES